MSLTTVVDTQQMDASQPGGVKRIPVVKRHYDAAQTTRHNSKHWLNATGDDANTLISPALAILRNRCRYEIRNNSYANGMINSLATDVVGNAGFPTLQVMTDNDGFNSQVEGGFGEWAMTCDAAGRMTAGDMLRLAVYQFVESGEALFVKQYMADGYRLRMLEPDYLQTPWSMTETETMSDGIEVGSYGEPVRYYISKSHPGDMRNYKLISDYTTVPADRVIHLYRIDRPGQLRGVPWMTPALPLFAQLRRYTASVLDAAETAANFAGVIYTDSTDLDPVDVDTLDTIEIERNSLMSLPAQWQLQQLKAEQPASTYAEFKKEIINEIARCLCMPFNIAAANSSGYNYSSGKLDRQVYWGFIRWIQSLLANHFLDMILRDYIREATMVRALPKVLNGEVSWRWIWSGPKHADPQKEATGQATRLANGTVSLIEECAEEGRDWEEVLTNRARVEKKKAELGLLPVVSEQKPQEPEDETNEDQDNEDQDNKDSDEDEPVNAKSDS